MKLLFQLLIVLILSSMVFAQEWTADTRVTSTLFQTQGIAVARDPQDAVLHAVVVESGVIDNVYYIQIDANGSLRDAGQISFTAGEAKQPSIAVDSLRNKHIVWADAENVNLNYRVFYSKFDSNGNAVIDRRIIADAATISSPQVVVDGQNNAHIVWSDIRDGNWEIYYEKVGSDGSTIINDRRLTTSLGTSFNPSMFYEAQANQIHVAFEDNRDLDPEVYYMRLGVNGNVLAEARVTNARGRSLAPSISAGSGSAYIVYSDYRVGNYPEIYLARVDSQNAVLERQVTAEFGWPIQPSITMLPNDNEAHVVWEDHQHGNAEIYYSKRDGGNLSGRNARLTNNAAHSAGSVITGDVRGALHVLWQDMRDGNWEAYHKGTINPSQLQHKIALEGDVRIGETVRLRISGPARGAYVSALSRSLGQSFGLATDDIFFYSVNDPPAVGFGGDSRGNFDDKGKATVTLNVPDRRGLIGQTFYFNYAIYERGRLQTLTEPYALTVRA